MRNLLVPKSQNVGKNVKAIGLSSFKCLLVSYSFFLFYFGHKNIRLYDVILYCDESVELVF